MRFLQLLPFVPIILGVAANPLAEPEPVLEERGYTQYVCYKYQDNYKWYKKCCKKNTQYFDQHKKQCYDYKCEEWTDNYHNKYKKCCRQDEYCDRGADYGKGKCIKYKCEHVVKYKKDVCCKANQWIDHSSGCCKDRQDDHCYEYKGKTICCKKAEKFNWQQWKCYVYSPPVKYPVHCPASHYVWGGRCYPRCPHPSYWNNGHCYCPRGYYVYKGKCVKRSCPENQYESYGKCYDKCKHPQVYDWHNHKCRCADGWYQDGYKCVQRPSCHDGAYSYGNECRCRGDYQVYKHGRCVCKKTQQPPRYGQQCENPDYQQCYDGATRVGHECVCPGKYTKYSNNKCVCKKTGQAPAYGQQCENPDYQQCYDGATRVGYECVCPGKFTKYSNNKCVCKATGNKPYGGECPDPNPVVTCPTGSVVYGDTCKCTGVGQTYEQTYGGGKCVCTSNHLPPGPRGCSVYSKASSQKSDAAEGAKTEQAAAPAEVKTENVKTEQAAAAPADETKTEGAKSEEAATSTDEEAGAPAQDGDAPPAGDE